MKAFNRVAMVIVAAAILAGAMIVLLVATEVITQAFLPSDWFDVPLQSTVDATGGTLAAIIAVSIIIALAMIILAFMELMPFRNGVAFLISSGEAGITTIDQASVRVLAEKTGAAAHNVRGVRCQVGEGPNGLTISSQASVALGSNIPEVSAELQSKIKEAVERFTGLPVAQVNVKAKYESVEAKRLAVR